MPKIPITPPNRSTDELAPGSGGVEMIDGFVDPVGDAFALYRRGGLWQFWWSGLQDPIDGMYWWEELGCLLVACTGRVFAFKDLVSAPTEITTPTCRLNFGNQTVFASSGTWLMMTSKNSVPIMWNGTGTAKYLPNAPKCDSVCFANDYFLLDEAGTNFVHMAFAVTNQPAGPLYQLGAFFSPDASPDRLVRVDGRFGEVLLFGSRSVEFWYLDESRATAVDADGNLLFTQPFARNTGSFLEYGMGAPESLAFFDNSHIWLSPQKQVILLTGRTPKVISLGFDRVFRAMTRTDDAKGFMVDNRFYCLAFPTDDFTLVYDFYTQSWSKWSYWVPPNYERFLGSCSAWSPAWDTQFVGSRKDGRVMIYHRNLVTDMFNPIRLMYRTAHLDWGTLDWKQSERLIMRLRRGM